MYKLYKLFMSPQVKCQDFFSPYPHSSSVTSVIRREQTLTKPCSKRSYTHKFCCLSGWRDCKVPQLWEKMDLESSGLGEKNIFFPGTRYFLSLYFGATELVKL